MMTVLEKDIDFIGVLVTERESILFEYFDIDEMINQKFFDWCEQSQAIWGKLIYVSTGFVHQTYKRRE